MTRDIPLDITQADIDQARQEAGDVSDIDLDPAQAVAGLFNTMRHVLVTEDREEARSKLIATEAHFLRYLERAKPDERDPQEQAREWLSSLGITNPGELA